MTIIVRLSLGRTSESALAFKSFVGAVKQGSVSRKSYSAGSSSSHYDDKLSLKTSERIPVPEQATNTPPVFTPQSLSDSKGQAPFPENDAVVEYKLLKTNFDDVLRDKSAESDPGSVLTSRHVDPTLVHQVYYFDTLAFVKKLEASGFSRQQAEGCAECLVEVINTTLDHQGRHMVTKLQKEITVQQLLAEIASVKKDMTLLQKTEFSSLKTDTEKMSFEMSQIQGHMNDEIVKLKGQFSLDINLERGRAIEAHAENEKRLQMLHNKIDTEVANLKTTYEVYRNDIFKYAGGTVIAVGTLVLGILRLWH
ncbi:mitochondrial calcium uniporter regulator 1 [Aplysia californica]|uniref:Mitochondrial calcium uniporter regulator 1 n=1 Tax=Aplysia californica TaxID=6500 RepID=A0ABM0K8D5_APLCA|nr:mitochondrial calcium uniporter regulator 1 [Aplysia californica]